MGSNRGREARSRTTTAKRLPATFALALAGVVSLLGAGCGRSQPSQQVAQSDQGQPEEIERSHVGKEQPSRAAQNAEPAEQTAGIGRPCAEAGEFDHYYLGAAFGGLDLVSAQRECEPPPKKIRDAAGTLVYERGGRVNVVSYIYGRCAPPNIGRTSQSADGCVPPLQVTSAPACEQPHSLYTRYKVGGDGGPSVPHKHVRIRGVSAAVFRDGGPMRVEIYAGNAKVVVSGRDPSLVARAGLNVIAHPASRGGMRSPDGALPQPRKGAAEDQATASPPCD